MAREGLYAARRYASIAPAAPHALHMPSHIYARLGLWPDDIRSNLSSKAASEEKAGMHVGAEARLHAMEFLEYAYLQIGHADEAQRIVIEAATVKQSDVTPMFAGYYPIVEARFPSLFAIETQDWTTAGRLEPVAGAGRFSQGLTLLAHAVAAGHRHDARAGKAAAQAIDALLAKAPRLPPDLGVTGLGDEIHAWSDFSQGDLRGAVALLRPIADRQASLGKEEVELPAREMLAEILLLGGSNAEALHEYQLSLLSDPGRFNALLGAGRSAEQLGQRALAVRYYRMLLANCEGASGAAVKLLEHARTVVNETRG